MDLDGIKKLFFLNGIRMVNNMVIKEWSTLIHFSYFSGTSSGICTSSWLSLATAPVTGWIWRFLICSLNGDFTTTLDLTELASGKHTKSYWTWPLKSLIYPWNMVIFHSYVSWPEGIHDLTITILELQWIFDRIMLGIHHGWVDFWANGHSPQ